MPKKILILAASKPVEALRVAAGLTLSDAELQVMSLSALPDCEQAQSQLEALEFAEVAPQALPASDPGRWTTLARAVMASDAVYVI